jgi:hypothetical protein
MGAEAATEEGASLEDVVAETDVKEPVAIEPVPPVAAAEIVPADERVSTDAEPAPEPREEEK